MKLMQTNKGEFGYLKRERKRRIIIAAIMLGVPVFIFISMWIYLGTRNTIWTIIAIAVCGNTVVGYTSDPKADTNFMASEAQKLVRKNGYKVDVKILGELRPFLERLDSMNEHKESLEEGLRFTPDPRYPDFTRDEMVKHVILNLCI